MKSPPKSPWSFIPTIYVTQGIPYFVVQTTTTTLLTLLKLPLDTIGTWNALAMSPWSAKALWSPFIDRTLTKRRWTIATELALALAIAALALAVDAQPALTALAITLAVIALLSATHDIACDGFYMLALDASAQARFVGIRSAAFRLGRIAITGGVVALAGTLQESGQPIPRAWSLALGAAALATAALALWNLVALPRPTADDNGTNAERTHATPFVTAFTDWLRTPRVAALVAFIFLYRTGEQMLTTIAPSFLIVSHAEGGAALTPKSQGLWYGTVGVLALLAGGWLSGVAIARFGLRRCLWPFAIAMHAPNLLFVWLALVQPGELAVGGVVLVEQLAYGLGFSSFMVVLLAFSRRAQHPTSHYAISTGLMGLSGMAASKIAGWIAGHWGFAVFFGVVSAAAIPGLITLFLVRLPDEDAAPSRASG